MLSRKNIDYPVNSKPFALQSWQLKVSAEEHWFLAKTWPMLNDLLSNVLGNAYELKKDHFCFNWNNRNRTINFIRNYLSEAELVTGLDNFKEPGRILATLKLEQPLQGFNFIELRQARAGKPEPEEIEHMCFCLVDKQGQYLPESSRQQALAQLLVFFGLDETTAKIDNKKFHDWLLQDIEKDIFQGKLTAVKFSLATQTKSYQVELRVTPIQETLAGVEPGLLEILRP
ncbi:MAG: hypothetical protein LBJ74_02975 [Heliobacteriaceae bacterium]|jgi:hypothetical protein|nr:hypothetical protein [Heliobacteriaceae bacterium]